VQQIWPTPTNIRLACELLHTINGNEFRGYAPGTLVLNGFEAVRDSIDHNKFRVVADVAKLDLGHPFLLALRQVEWIDDHGIMFKMPR
jgi:hypothetical protein